MLKGETPLLMGLNVPQHNFSRKPEHNRRTKCEDTLHTGETQASTEVLTATKHGLAENGSSQRSARNGAKVFLETSLTGTCQ